MTLAADGFDLPLVLTCYCARYCNVTLADSIFDRNFCPLIFAFQGLLKS